MPRYHNKRDFQIGDYWLSKQYRSPAYCRTWFDRKTQQTRRASLGTTDIEEAKQRLTDWFIIEHQQKGQKTEEVTIAAIFARYYEKSASKLLSANSVQRNLSLWLEHFEEATLEEASDLNRQEGFRNWLVKEKGLSLSTVRKIVGMGKTAFGWAHKRGEIEAVPYFELVKVPTPEPKGRHMEVAEVANYLRRQIGIICVYSSCY